MAHATGRWRRYSWVLGGRTVDLTQVTMPALNIYAQADHIIPPPTSRALTGKLGITDYTELGVPGGHIGMFVSSRSQGIVGHGIVDWLAERDHTAAARAGNQPERRATARQETPDAH